MDRIFFKTSFFIAVLISLTTTATSQDTTVTRLTSELKAAHADTIRIKLLLEMANASYIDDAWKYVNQALMLARKTNHLFYEAKSLRFQAGMLNSNGDPANALEKYIEALHIYEKLGDLLSVATIELILSGLYSDIEDHDNALLYARRGAVIYQELNNKKGLVNANCAIGYAYYIMDRADSALYYNSKAYSDLLTDNVLKTNNDLVAYASANLGETYLKLNQYAVALEYLKSGVRLSESPRDIAWDCYDIALVFKAMNKPDSAIYYCKKGIELAQSIKFNVLLIKATSLLSELYKPISRDSAYTYLLLHQQTRDSVFSREKIAKAKNVTFQQQIHEQEKEAQKNEEKLKRKLNVQYALIALAIMSFLILFFILSNSVVLNDKWISFFGILSLLVVFEFINLFIHPYLAHITHESPLLMLLALVVIASLLIPLHHRLEKWIKEKMIEKNKAIRLKAAKKTIEQLSKKEEE